MKIADGLVVGGVGCGGLGSGGAPPPWVTAVNYGGGAMAWWSSAWCLAVYLGGNVGGVWPRCQATRRMFFAAVLRVVRARAACRSKSWCVLLALIRVALFFLSFDVFQDS